ncbi:MAG TPA: hypothetical protein DEA08_14065, partial [Planctomycetes bacterium]|nr:hypothetical protein [Planctomycetota bacterium]
LTQAERIAAASFLRTACEDPLADPRAPGTVELRWRCGVAHARIGESRAAAEFFRAAAEHAEAAFADQLRTMAVQSLLDAGANEEALALALESFVQSSGEQRTRLCRQIVAMRLERGELKRAEVALGELTRGGSLREGAPERALRAAIALARAPEGEAELAALRAALPDDARGLWQEVPRLQLARALANAGEREAALRQLRLIALWIPTSGGLRRAHAIGTQLLGERRLALALIVNQLRSLDEQERMIMSARLARAFPRVLSARAEPLGLALTRLSVAAETPARITQAEAWLRYGLRHAREALQDLDSTEDPKIRRVRGALYLLWARLLLQAEARPSRPDLPRAGAAVRLSLTDFTRSPPIAVPQDAQYRLDAAFLALSLKDEEPLLPSLLDEVDAACAARLAQNPAQDEVRAELERLRAKRRP